MLQTRIALILALSLFSRDAICLDLCGNLLVKFIYYLQRGTLSKLDNPVTALRNELKAKGEGDLLDRNNPRSVFALEDDVLDLFGTAPSLRSTKLETFKRRWNLTDEQSLDILTYYGTQIFFKDVGVIGELSETMLRVGAVNRQHFLADTETYRLARHYRYYLANLTRLSVPEMAEQLQVSEKVVYSEISKLGLSLQRAFNEPLSSFGQRGAREELDKLGRPDLKHLINPQAGVGVLAKQLVQGKLSTEEVAKVLGIGRQAMDFIFHHRNESNRGTIWNRVFEFEGQMMPEPAILVELNNRGLTDQQIATKINELAGASPGDENFRTSAGIGEKLGLMGEREKHEYSDDFPPLLIIGHFLKNPTQTNIEIARHLGTSPSVVSRVLLQNHLVGLGGDQRRDNSGSPEADEMIRRYADQKKSVDEVWEWMKANNFAYPVRKNFGSKDGQIRVRQSRLYGVDSWGVGKEDFHRRIFNSQEDFVMALKARALQDGVKLSALSMSIQSHITERLRHVWREEATEMLLDWVQKNPGKPLVRDVFKNEDGKIPLKHSKVLGTGDYAPTGSLYNKRIFDSHLDMIISIKKAALARGIKFDLFRQKLSSEPTKEWKILVREEVLFEMLDWIKKHENRLPITGDYYDQREEGKEDIYKHDQVGRVPFAQARFYGTTPHGNSFFASQGEALLDLKKYAADNGVKIYLLDKNIKWDKVSEEVREEWKKEATEVLLDWAAAHDGKMPVVLDYPALFPHLSMTSSKVYGTSTYKEGGEQRATRIFDSLEQGRAHLEAEAKKRGLTLLFPKKGFQPLDPGAKE